MAIAVTYNGSNYSIPETGELNWSDLTAFLVDVATTANPSSTQKTTIATYATASVNVTLTDRTVLLTHTPTAPVAVALPAGVDGQIFHLKDAGGNAGANAITITPNGTDTIEGEATALINENWGFVELQFDGDTNDWKILAESLRFSAAAATAGNIIAALDWEDETGAGQALRVQVPFATGAVAGVVSTTTQTFAGAKTFTGNAVFSAQLDQVYDAYFTGFLTWADASPYHSVTGNTYTLHSGGTGRIKGVPVSWTGGQTVTLTAYQGHWIYVDSAGTIGSQTSTPTLSQYQSRVYVAEVYYDGTNAILVKENHPYDFQTHASAYLHNNVGIVVRNTDGAGATIAKIGTTTGASANDRKLSITADTLEDHGLETTIAANGTGISVSLFYKDGSARWVRYGAYTELPMVSNVAGTVTALTTGPNDDVSVIRIYVTKGDGNTGESAQYIGVLNYAASAGDRFDSVTDATNAIAAGTISVADGALAALELAQLGYVVIVNNASGGYIERVVIEKSTFNTRLVGGGAGSSANLVSVNTSGFGGILSAADGNVQAALDTIDDHTHASLYEPLFGFSTYFDQAVKTTSSPTYAAVIIGATGSAGARKIYGDADSLIVCAGSADGQLATSGGTAVLTWASGSVVIAQPTTVNGACTLGAATAENFHTMYMRTADTSTAADRLNDIGFEMAYGADQRVRLAFGLDIGNGIAYQFTYGYGAGTYAGFDWMSETSSGVYAKVGGYSAAGAFSLGVPSLTAPVSSAHAAYGSFEVKGKYTGSWTFGTGASTNTDTESLAYFYNLNYPTSGASSRIAYGWNTAGSQILGIGVDSASNFIFGKSTGSDILKGIISDANRYGYITTSAAWARGPAAANVLHTDFGGVSSVYRLYTGGASRTLSTAPTAQATQTTWGDQFTDLSTSAWDVAGATGLGNGSIIHCSLINTSGDHGTFTIYVGLDSGSSYKFVGVAGGNCSLSETGEGIFEISGLGDGRTYTLTFNTSGASATLKASSTATGTTTLRMYIINLS